jgi:hypothetical protein
MTQVAGTVLYPRRQNSAEVNGYGVYKEGTAVKYVNKLRNALKRKQ